MKSALLFYSSTYPYLSYCHFQSRKYASFAFHSYLLSPLFTTSKFPLDITQTLKYNIRVHYHTAGYSTLNLFRTFHWANLPRPKVQWNKLPHGFQICPSISTFKTNIIGYGLKWWRSQQTFSFLILYRQYYLYIHHIATPRFTSISNPLQHFFD